MSGLTTAKSFASPELSLEKALCTRLPCPPLHLGFFGCWGCAQEVGTGKSSPCGFGQKFQECSAESAQSVSSCGLCWQKVSALPWGSGPRLPRPRVHCLLVWKRWPASVLWSAAHKGQLPWPTLGPPSSSWPGVLMCSRSTAWELWGRAEVLPSNPGLTLLLFFPLQFV